MHPHVILCVVAVTLPSLWADVALTDSSWLCVWVIRAAARVALPVWVRLEPCGVQQRLAQAWMAIGRLPR